jgi:predicted GNAT family acetyltransferase
VAALSQELLEGGRRFCFLFADARNATSNHIYRAIGYQPVAEVEEIDFEGGIASDREVVDDRSA